MHAGRCGLGGKAAGRSLSAGGGPGTFYKVDSAVSGASQVSVTTSFVVRPVASIAGGIDMRLSRRLSLRAEARDFVSGANLGGVSGHNHPVFLAGLAFHF